MNVFDEVTAFNLINFHNDGLKLGGKLTVINIDKYKIESFLKNFLSFLNQLFILRSGDVDINPGPLTIYIILVQYFTRKSTHLKLFHKNCQSLLKKKHVLQYMMNDLSNNTILAFSETWLKENDDEKLWRLNETLFKSFRCDRKSNEKQQGGGVMIIAPKHLNPKLRISIDKKKHLSDVSCNPHKSLCFDFLEELSDSIELVEP